MLGIINNCGEVRSWRDISANFGKQFQPDSPHLLHELATSY